ncbi:hypothetical protein LTR92_001101 [Exophiala xenobiotica]|nr:hypothetical protein LTR92_001101 [Exophiala xenobiotica]
MEISVGLAAGLIAIAIAVLQVIVPNTLTVILVSTLSNEHNAVTWSAVAHSLSNSLWPSLLRSDMATSQGIPRRINLVTWLRPLSLALIAAAAFVTPIGLYEALVLSDSQELVTFSDILDSGTIGIGTPPRSDLGFSRQCWGTKPLQCPGTENVVTDNSDVNGINVTISDDGYDRRIPKVLAQLYQSGLQQKFRSVSSYFDIQARQYQFQNQYSPNNDSFLVDSFRPMGSMILDDSVSLVDGLIVDMHKGGVGFRKHTVPAGLHYGAEWDEDILFIEPETVCVDMNMTIEVQIPEIVNTYNGSAPNSYLVDQGGWAKMNITNPYLDPWFEDMQTALLNDGNPSLQGRAYRAGWVTNVQNMYFFNISKPNTNRTAYLTSQVGQRFPINTTYSVATKDELLFTSFASLFTGIPSGFDWGNGTLEVYNTSFGPQYWNNPWNITSENYTDIGTLCTGAMTGDLANMTNLDVKCALMLGPSRRLDGTQSTVFSPGSWWTRQIYSCASASKASIKSVHFKYNATTNEGLGSLNVTRLTQKVYANESTMPLWGVETPNMKLNGLGPFWGLISPDQQDSVNLSTIRAEKLYIPASSNTVWGSALSDLGGTDFNPGTNGPPQIWNTIYSTLGGGFDYTGSSNLALLQKWQKMWTNTTGAAQIINLIFTDYAANYFVGTRSQLTPRDYLPPNLMRNENGKFKRDGDTVSSEAGQVPIQVYQRRIRYHYVYGIPAAITLVLFVVILVVACLSMLLGRGSIARIRHYVYGLSAGRLLGAFLFPEEGDPHADTKVWIEKVGRRSVKLPDPDGPGVMMLSEVQKPKPKPSADSGGYALIEQDQKASTTVAMTPRLSEGEEAGSDRARIP